MKILIVFGTRPEVIKLAPLIYELKRFSKIFRLKICSTGQHRQMIEQFLKNFDIKPDHNLKIMEPNQTLAGLSNKILTEMDKLLSKERPDLIIVQGDTTSAFVASLVAFYHQIKIAHLEAGLRTSDKYNPYPEEINRRLIDVLSDIYFVPTKEAEDNLKNMGIENKKIFLVGNTVVDACLFMGKKISSSVISQKIASFFRKKYGLTFGKKKTILVTGHRRESFGRDFKQILLGLKKIAEENENVQLVYPVHLNPNVKKPAMQILGNAKRIYLTDPLDYPFFIWLIRRSFIVLTDSGGIQEEAPSFKKPVLVMRKKTERVEGIKAGVAKLVGVEVNSIYKETSKLLLNKKVYQKMLVAKNPYGDGRAAKRIVKILKNEDRIKSKN